MEAARRFAERWYAAWNAQRLGGSVANLDAIMACYHEGIEHSSPFIARFNAGMGAGMGTGMGAGTDRAGEATLRGKAAVGAYFGRALERNPTPPGVTRFEPMHLTVGMESVLVVYRRWTGELAGEVFFLDAAGLIVRSVSHYG